MPEGIDKVMGVDVIAHLLAFISVNPILPARHGAFHEVGQKSVKLGSRMGWSGQTSSAEYTRFHAEIPAIFLDHDIRGDFRGAAAAPPAAAELPLPPPPRPPPPSPAPLVRRRLELRRRAQPCTATAAHPAMSLQINVDSEQATFTLHEVPGYPFPAAQ